MNYMRWLLHPAVILYLWLLIPASTLYAAEVANLKTRLFSTHMSIEYELLGSGIQTESVVELWLTIKGRRYSSQMLTVSGDFGRSITPGKNRRIIWMHPQDFPEGLDATFTCSVNAVADGKLSNESISPSEGFKASNYAINKQTIVETRTGLMWTRNATIPAKPMTHADAEKLLLKINQDRYAGYDDWRIPTRADFEGLVSSAKKEGWGTSFAHYIADYLSTCGFTRVQAGNYWTATASDDGPDNFYVANTWNGIIRPLAGSNYYYLWPVRTAH